jgi:hypothetical protein
MEYKNKLIKQNHSIKCSLSSNYWIWAWDLQNLAVKTKIFKINCCIRFKKDQLNHCCMVSILIFPTKTNLKEISNFSSFFCQSLSNAHMLHSSLTTNAQRSLKSSLFYYFTLVSSPLSHLTRGDPI